ncbi:hypothetical protein Ddye_008532 [Dipteronia dyeriana]|uniref:Exocyst complex component SEC5 n=1 Tax=Dipteronia dyeriana TaxID=168575 RepID=A0AAE0CLE4_9ROSI|nr:hypothetical protein Ddye_008532 [Dipteronia dyeriana]
MVKDNFDCFVSCKTTIDGRLLKLKRIEDDLKGLGTSYLFNMIQGVNYMASSAFEPLFERQVGPNGEDKVYPRNASEVYNIV